MKFDLNKTLKVMGPLCFAIVSILAIYFGSDRSESLADSFKNSSFDIKVQSIKENQKDHMNITVYHKQGKWVISPFMRERYYLFNLISKDDRIVKEKNESKISVFRKDSLIDIVFVNFY